MKILSLKLPASLDAELEAAAARRGTTKSALLREALASYLGAGAGEPRAADPAGDVREPDPPPYGEPEEPAKPSFLELAGDLAGCLEGPEDLSSNPEHLSGFGR